MPSAAAVREGACHERLALLAVDRDEVFAPPHGCVDLLFANDEGAGALHERAFDTPREEEEEESRPGKTCAAPTLCSPLIAATVALVGVDAAAGVLVASAEGKTH